MSCKQAQPLFSPSVLLGRCSNTLTLQKKISEIHEENFALHLNQDFPVSIRLHQTTLPAPNGTHITTDAFQDRCGNYIAYSTDSIAVTQECCLT